MRMRRRNTHYSAWDLVERKRFRETIQYDLLVVFTKRDLIAQHQSLGMFVQRVILPEWRRALVITIDMSTMLASMPAARVAGQPRAIRVPHTVIPILPRSRHGLARRCASRRPRIAIRGFFRPAYSYATAGRFRGTDPRIAIRGRRAAIQ